MAQSLVKIQSGKGKYRYFTIMIHFSSFSFSEDLIQNVITLKRILRCFELALGLKINLCKSKLIGILVRENPRKEATLKLVIKKMIKKLSTWTISLWWVGLPHQIYYVLFFQSFFKMSKCVGKILKNIQRSFCEEGKKENDYRNHDRDEVGEKQKSPNYFWRKDTEIGVATGTFKESTIKPNEG
ncbi:hypothetical protein CR513_19926, partial [Mucuna pruriens]